MQKMEVFQQAANKHGLPDRTYTDRLTLLSGNESIDLFYFGKAHTDGDTFVLFRNARVLHTGDAFANRGQPNIDLNNGGSGIAYPDTLAKAAATIYGRVLELFGGRTPQPAELLGVDAEALRATGLSGRKVEYVRDLAAHVESGELELDRLTELSDEEVVAEISAIRGFGVWSAHMFLIFHLERPDVLPTGDLGIRRAVERAYDLDALPAPTELERIAEPWRPHRSLASLYLWESLANAPVD